MTAREIILSCKDLKPGGIRWYPVPQGTRPASYRDTLRKRARAMGDWGLRFSTDSANRQVAIWRQKPNTP